MTYVFVHVCKRYVYENGFHFLGSRVTLRQPTVGWGDFNQLLAHYAVELLKDGIYKCIFCLKSRKGLAGI